jgi:KDO2-lipid IV(A) lauroyltransferase
VTAEQPDSSKNAAAPTGRRRTTSTAPAAAEASFEAPHKRQAENWRTRLAGVVALRAWRTMSWVVGHVPAGISYRVGGWAMMLGYAFSPTRRRWLRTNYSHVLGVLPSDPKTGKLARAAFRTYARYVIELARMPWLTKEQAAALVDVQNVDHLIALHKEGHGVVMVGAHMGNNEVAAGGFVTKGLPLDVVGDDTAFGPLYEQFARERGKFGLRMISWRNLRGVFGAMRRGAALVLLVDWGYRPDGIPVKMFGAWTMLPAGPAVLAARFGAPIVPFEIVRHPDGCFYAGACPPIHVASDSPADLARATQEYANVLERHIAAAPEQWYIFKPIWPSTPEEEARLAAMAAAMLGPEGGRPA